MFYICIPTTPERRGRVGELVKSIQENVKTPHCLVVYENNDGGWVKAVHNMLEGIDGYVSLLGSDCIVHNDYLARLWEKYQENFTDDTGVCEPFNEMHAHNLAQHPFAHSKTIKKYLDKDFIHWYSDVWFTDQARADQKLIYVPEAKIEHRHFINGKAVKDKTYETIFNPITIAKDKATYERKKTA